ncbi:hypothetical protein ACFQ0B_45765 [Nonomuraea thailandensis]
MVRAVGSPSLSARSRSASACTSSRRHMSARSWRTCSGRSGSRRSMPSRVARMDGAAADSSMTICRRAGTVLICAMHWARRLRTPSASRWSVAGRTRQDTQSRRSPEPPITSSSRSRRSSSSAV